MTSFGRESTFAVSREGGLAVAAHTEDQAGCGNALERASGAEANRILKSIVHRVFQTFSVQPHRSKTFKLSTDPFFVEKVRDIVCLYLNPPDHAILLVVDEEVADSSAQPDPAGVAHGPRLCGRVTHNYVRQ